MKPTAMLARGGAGVRYKCTCGHEEEIGYDVSIFSFPEPYTAARLDGGYSCPVCPCPAGGRMYINPWQGTGAARVLSLGFSAWGLGFRV